MADIKTIEIQDNKNNIYYPHTNSSVVRYNNSNVKNELDDLNLNIQTINSNIETLKNNINIKINTINANVNNLNNKLNGITENTFEKITITFQNGWQGNANFYLMDKKLLIGNVNIYKETTNVNANEVILTLNGVNVKTYNNFHVGALICGSRIMEGSIALQGNRLTIFNFNPTTTPRALLVANICVPII